MKAIENMTVVIRSSKERTEHLCKLCIEKQGVPVGNIFTIHESPFSKAMKKGYQIGLDQNQPWTYVIDADVLLRKGAIKNMLNVAEKMPENLIGISGILLDKLMGMKRTAGNYLFSTRVLQRMIDKIKPYEEESIRPESSIISVLQKQGFIYQKVDQFIGLHDFEQHYHDIARKAFTHANKHPEYLGELVTFWRDASEHDSDFIVALYGLSKGVATQRKVRINIDNFSDLYAEVSDKFGSRDTDISEFAIQNFDDVYATMHDPKNYFQEDQRLKKFYDKKLQKRLDDLSNIQLAKKLFINIKNKIG